MSELLLLLALELGLGSQDFRTRERFSAELERSPCLWPHAHALQFSADVEVSARARRVATRHELVYPDGRGEELPLYYGKHKVTVQLWVPVLVCVNVHVPPSEHPKCWVWEVADSLGDAEWQRTYAGATLLYLPKEGSYRLVMVYRTAAARQGAGGVNEAVEVHFKGTKLKLPR